MMSFLTTQPDKKKQIKTLQKNTLVQERKGNDGKTKQKGLYGPRRRFIVQKQTFLLKY